MISDFRLKLNIAAFCKVGWFTMLASTSLYANDVPLHGQSVVRFASIAEAQAILGARDRYVAALSPFDRQSRLETDRDVTEDEFLRFVASQAQPWAEDQIIKLTGIVGKLRAKLSSYRLPFPLFVLLIQTNGREEGHACYCRANAIVMPTDTIARPADQLERIVTHELFHILSSHNPAWRKKLYEVIGFHTCPSIEFPASLAKRKLTNPDAPEPDCYITVTVDGEAISAAPILFSNSERFDPQQRGSFFRYMVFRLMAVEKNAGKWRAVERDGELRLLLPKATPDFSRQIGRNTSYTIHPDEILADNFMHLIQQTPSLPSPEIIDEMRQLLEKP